jgi:hypothetical protein
MPSIAYPQVNGHRYSWVSLEVSIGVVASGTPMVGVRSINWSDELAPGVVYGTKPQPIGYTRGKQTITADMELLLAEWENLRLGLGGVGFGEVLFDIVVNFHEFGVGVQSYVLIGCRVTKVEQSNSDSTDASMVKLTLATLKVLHNGATIARPIGGL